MLTPDRLPALRGALTEAGLDGWLLYDFHGCNPVAAALMGLVGMTTRRAFAWFPNDGTPVAVTHAIEQDPWRDWPAAWRRERYSSWRSLESIVAGLVSGKRIAMEYSPGDAVPYLDRVPAGVLELVRNAGGEVLSSGALVTRFFASWAPEDVASHRRAAERLAAIARDAFRLAAQRARGSSPAAEHEIVAWIRDRFAREGLVADHGPNVSAGPNAANPHYEPSEQRPRLIRQGDVLLIDLWAREPQGVYADQTWMCSLGEPTAEARRVWAAVRDARDVAIDLVQRSSASGALLRGADVDDAAREVITARGFGDYFPHRTGHSIDPHDLHGAGPHLDNLETREERRLVPGVAFSIEPGIYIPGRIGIRSEVNVYLLDGEAVVTPSDYQRDLLVL